MTVAGSAERLQSGQSRTEWGLRLEPASSAACSGGGTSGFATYSFITPTANDPAALVFNRETGPVAPAGSFAHPLYEVDGQPYRARPAGSAGEISGLATARFDFSRFSIDGRNGTLALPAGDYHVGIACWNDTTASADRYWDPILTVSATAADPNGLAWTRSSDPATLPAGADEAAPPRPLARTGSSITLWLLWGAVLLGAGGVAVASTRRDDRYR